MSVPTGSPIDIRIILPLVFKLKTIIGSWLSRHMAMEVASMTASDLDRTSRYETSRYITAPGNCKGSLSYTPSTRVALAITSARISRARRVAAVSVEKYGFEVPPAKTQTRPFSRWRRARRRMYGSATSCISMALMTRVCTPICSKASCNDRELMTVASMPMWSAVTRSMFWAAAAMPRKILPPPTTSPIWTPAAATAATSAASSLTRAALMPKAAPPASASPLSLSTIRLYCDTGVGRPFGAGFGRGHVAHLVPGKPRNSDVLAQLGDLGFDQLADGEAGFLDEGLIEQADFFVILRQPAFHDAVDHVGGFAFESGAAALDVALFLERFAGDVLLADITRVGGGDVHGDIVHQFLEIGVARHEIGLAVDFHQHAELAARMDVTADQALFGEPRGLLVGGRDTALPQNDFCVADVAVGLHQGALAFHHAGAGAVAELLYELRGNVHELSVIGYQLSAVSFQLRSNRSEEHTSELQSLRHLVCRLLL